MKYGHKGLHRMILRGVCIFTICLAGALFFLNSIRSLLAAEAQDHLIEAANGYARYFERIDQYKYSENSVEIIKDDINVDFFDKKTTACYFLRKNKNVAVCGFQAKDIADRISKDYNSISDYLELDEPLRYGTVYDTKSELIGDNIAIVLKAKKPLSGYFLIMVPRVEYEREMNQTLLLGVILVFLSGMILLLVLIFNGYKRYVYRKSKIVHGQIDPITKLIGYTVHKEYAQKYVNNDHSSYAYVSFSIEKYNLITQLNNKEVCDRMLREIATTITQLLGEEETMGREEDSFGMLLVYDNELKFRQRLILMFKQASVVSVIRNNFCKVVFRCGICITTPQMNIDRAIRQAKKARFEAERSTLSNIQFSMSKKGRNESYHQLEKEVEEACDKGQFLVYYQPKFNMEEKVVGAEALIRWEHPKDGLLNPDIFLPVFEENGMITKIDLYMLKDVCQRLQNWEKDGKTMVPISINFSIRNLNYRLLAKDILKIVDEYKIPHSYIELEFAEKAYYEHKERFIEVMKELSSYGFILSIDNFKTGYGARHILKELPIQILKVDKGLVRDLDDYDFVNKDRTMVMHIIDCAKETNIKVVAEGVETSSQLEVLKKHNCDMIQGYYYQKPMPPDELEFLLTQG